MSTPSRRALRAALALVAASLVVLAALPSGASALRTHNTVPTSFELEPECQQTFSSNAGKEIVADESRELLYVACTRNPGTLGPVVKRYHYDGSPAPFTFSAPYIQGNTIIGNPKSPELEWNIHQFQQTFMGLAVDNSDANSGYIYVAGSCDRCGPVGFGERMVEVFKPSGEWTRELDPLESHEALDVDVDDAGNVYVVNTGGKTALIRKFDPSSLSEVERLFPVEVSDYVRVDSQENVWAGGGGGLLVNDPLVKWEADAFSTEWDDEDLAFSFAEGSEPPEVPSSPYVSPSGELQIPEMHSIDVDRSNDYLYIENNTGIHPFTPGSPEEYAHETGQVIGAGLLNQSEAFELTRDGNVFATAGRMVYRWGPGDIVPDLRTPAPSVDELDHTEATLHAHVERSSTPNGEGTPIVACKIRWGASPNPASWTDEAPCTPDPAGGAFTAPDTAVSGVASALTTGQTYYYRFEATNEDGSNYGMTRSFVPPYVLAVKTESAEVDPQSATLHGSFNPDGDATKYFFEYGATSGYGLSTEVQGPVSAPGKFDATAIVPELPSGKTFHYRIVAEDSGGHRTAGEDRVFRTASAPDVAGQVATNVAANSATLNARIDPVGYETNYYFEYGPTTSFGRQAPLGGESIGDGSGFVPVSQDVTGLQEGVTYFFRVVAENAWGKTVGETTTFNFAPPVCPNAHVRQQTGSNYLPDCRAYELVSQANAGAVLFFPSLLLNESFISAIPEFHAWPNNRGFASNPSRFTYWGSEGAATGTDVPNSTFDMYMATRTNTGWVHTDPVIHGSEAKFTGEKECSETQDFCLDHFVSDALSGSYKGQTAPALFNADGKFLGRLPTNVGVVEEGVRWSGQQRPSPDFSHFLFSSTDVKFTTDAVDGSGPAPGSAYDNDLRTKTVEVISRLQGGGDIPRDTCCDEGIKFPAVSSDGSHVLMSVNGVGGPMHLYMSIDDSIVVDVSKGFGVTFVGMTRNGSKVFFVANQQITDDDDDSGADLYMWSEASGEVTRISQGAGTAGNVDSCAGGACNVTPLDTERDGFFNLTGVPGLDDKIAETSGDVYFYSPEKLLDPQHAGVQNEANLYLYRDGAVQLVATFDPGTQVDRMQISADGDHAGLVTKSRLTGYDNNGRSQMYTYDADTGAIRCASCRPNGLKPSDNVEASQGGRFMTEDGRVFFATKDPLVPGDSNGAVTDVYEFVDGRPQLISAAISARDQAGAGIFFPPVRVGLEAVSRNGIDVYFASYDTLVPEDANGPFIKFYDARANGGFPPQYHVAPCEAADECHGEDSSAPPSPIIGTQGALGQSGNVKSQPKKAKPKRKAKRKGKKGKRKAKKGQRKRRDSRRSS